MPSDVIYQTDASLIQLRMFTLYFDFTAGVRAKRLMGNLRAMIGNGTRLTGELWKLDSVFPSGAIRRMIGQEAGESDVLVVAASCPADPEPRFVEWLDFMVNWKAHRFCPGLLVGLLGDEGHVVSPSNWMVNELAAFARQTRMFWRWHPGARETWDDANWLAEGMRQLLEAKERQQI